MWEPAPRCLSRTRCKSLSCQCQNAARSRTPVQPQANTTGARPQSITPHLDLADGGRALPLHPPRPRAHRDKLLGRCRQPPPQHTGAHISSRHHARMHMIMASWKSLVSGESGPSSAPEGWMPTVESKMALVAPALSATAMPCRISGASGPTLRHAHSTPQVWRSSHHQPSVADVWLVCLAGLRSQLRWAGGRGGHSIAAGWPATTQLCSTVPGPRIAALGWVSWGQPTAHRPPVSCVAPLTCARR